MFIPILKLLQLFTFLFRRILVKSFFVIRALNVRCLGFIINLEVQYLR